MWLWNYWLKICHGHCKLEWKRNLVAHGDAREEKWRGKRRLEWVASSFQFDSEQSIQCYYNRSPPTRTPRKPALDWTEPPADKNGLVRFAGRPNLVSALVPSHSIFTILLFFSDCVSWCSSSWERQKQIKRWSSLSSGIWPLVTG